MRCPDPLCEGPGPDCACALRAAAQPLGTFHLFRHLGTRAYSSSWWGWLRCRWRHSANWLFEEEMTKYERPPGALAESEMYCTICQVGR